MSLKQLRKNIKFMRCNIGYTQNQLDKLVDNNSRLVQRWETGVSVPSTDKLLRLSMIFNVSIDDLVRSSISVKAKNRNKDIINSLNYLNPKIEKHYKKLGDYDKITTHLFK